MLVLKLIHVRKRGPVVYGHFHYDDVIMTMLASQITSLTVVSSIVCSGVNQRKHQSSASLAFVWEIHRGPVNFPHKWPVTRKMFPFDDVIMLRTGAILQTESVLSKWCYLPQYSCVSWAPTGEMEFGLTWEPQDYLFRWENMPTYTFFSITSGIFRIAFTRQMKWRSVWNIFIHVDQNISGK